MSFGGPDEDSDTSDTSDQRRRRQLFALPSSLCQHRPSTEISAENSSEPCRTLCR